MTSRKDWFSSNYEGGQAWRANAACRDDPADSLWFPLESQMAPALAEAKIMCALCPVRNECLTYYLAMDSKDDQFGIAAGMTPEQRRQLRRARKRPSRAEGAA